ncbi:MAG: hypothetical protein LBR39_05020 [Coriobacteriales bacterium]|jgi:uncharacterized DUF497 family protein|nr:hypothetical protein [Coriobacteriales bacterium]
MATIVHPNALKHGLSEEEVVYAWETPLRCRQRQSDDEPLRWIAAGVLPDGRIAELVAVFGKSGDWLVFHAKTPPTKKFLKELGF